MGVQGDVVGTGSLDSDVGTRASFGEKIERNTGEIGGLEYRGTGLGVREMHISAENREQSLLSIYVTPSGPPVDGEGWLRFRQCLATTAPRNSYCCV